MNGYEFTVVQELYKEGVDKDGAPYVELVNPNLQTKWYCRDLGMISDFGQAYNTKGNIKIHHSIITVNGEDCIIKLPYSKTKALLTTPRPTKAGFKISKK